MIYLLLSVLHAFLYLCFLYSDIKQIWYFVMIDLSASPHSASLLLKVQSLDQQRSITGEAW